LACDRRNVRAIVCVELGRFCFDESMTYSSSATRRIASSFRRMERVWARILP
jgi:hypothetical protein